ncbi:MAG: transposase [Syntrophobacteraceae bacterium]
MFRRGVLTLEGKKVITTYNGRAEIENRIKEGKNTLRWDKTSCHRFAANQARLLVGRLAYNLLHMIRDAAFWGESVKPSVDSIVRRLVRLEPRWSTMPGGGMPILRWLSH